MAPTSLKIEASTGSLTVFEYSTTDHVVTTGTSLRGPYGNDKRTVSGLSSDAARAVNLAIPNIWWSGLVSTIANAPPAMLPKSFGRAIKDLAHPRVALMRGGLAVS